MIPIPPTEGMVRNGWWDSDGLATLLGRFHNSSHIAVVASSGNLLYRGHGPAIDHHDVVIRMNDADLQGYENDVGRRVDIRVATVYGARNAERKHIIGKDELTLVTFPFAVQNSEPWSQSDQLQGLHEIGLIDNAWARSLRSVQLEGHGKFASTGFVALAMAVAIARRSGVSAAVNVYGFGQCLVCKKYCDCDGRNDTSAKIDESSGIDAERKGLDGYHPFDKEAEVRKAWANAGVISLVEPSCAAWAVWQEHRGINCHPGNGAAIGSDRNNEYAFTVQSSVTLCQEACLRTINCLAVIVSSRTPVRCYFRNHVVLSKCVQDHKYSLFTFELKPPPRPRPAPVSPRPTPALHSPPLRALLPPSASALPPLVPPPCFPTPSPPGTLQLTTFSPTGSPTVLPTVLPTTLPTTSLSVSPTVLPTASLTDPPPSLLPVSTLPTRPPPLIAPRLLPPLHLPPPISSPVSLSSPKTPALNSPPSPSHSLPLPPSPPAGLWLSSWLQVQSAQLPETETAPLPRTASANQYSFSILWLLVSISVTFVVCRSRGRSWWSVFRVATRRSQTFDTRHVASGLMLHSELCALGSGGTGSPELDTPELSHERSPLTPPDATRLLHSQPRALRPGSGSEHESPEPSDNRSALTAHRTTDLD